MKKGDAGIWQRRFWVHHVRGPEELSALARYCHFNSVKHGEVGHPEEWAYSSVHREIRAGWWDYAQGRWAEKMKGGPEEPPIP